MIFKPLGMICKPFPIYYDTLVTSGNPFLVILEVIMYIWYWKLEKTFLKTDARILEYIN